MTIFLFILVLVVLIVVHEFGHFVVAKMSGMRVDEFGVGYPPRIIAFKKGETEYSLNWIPFGGFVRIYGEDEGSDEMSDTKDSHRAFARRPKILQALTLIAGIVMNLFFAYVLIAVVLFMGVPRAITPEEALLAPDSAVVIGSVLPGAPADLAGFKPGDAIVKIEGEGATFESASSDAFTAFIAQQEAGEELTVTVLRNKEEMTFAVAPTLGALSGEPERAALGISVGTVGTVPVSLLQAPIEGFRLTVELTRQTAVALALFFGSVFTLSADLAQVSGPVGIAGAVGTAYDQGLATLLTITAIISINLALINLLPIPALDGGRLLFVIIEAITRRPIKPVFARTINALGFGFLILLMVVITASDIFKAVG